MRLLKVLLLFIFVFIIVSLAPFAFEVGGNKALKSNSIGLEAYAFLICTILIAVEVFKFLIGKSGRTSNALIQIFSWEIGAFISTLFWFLGNGPLNGLTWAEAAIYGVLAALTSNGFAVTRTAKKVFKIFGLNSCAVK